MKWKVVRGHEAYEVNEFGSVREIVSGKELSVHHDGQLYVELKENGEYRKVKLAGIIANSHQDAFRSLLQLSLHKCKEKVQLISNIKVGMDGEY